MKVKNLKIYRGDLEVLREEYTQIGFDTSLDKGVLTVYALKRKKTTTEKKDKRKR